MTPAATPPAYAAEAALVDRLADIADAVSMERFRARDLHVEQKPDMSPVTEADIRIEALIRELLGRERPDDAVVGEEFGATGSPGAAWRWVLDPIDGTKSFARGNENWATLIALQHEGRTVVAVASAPASRQRFSAVRGGGARVNGEPLRTSAVTSLDGAMLAHTSLSGFTWAEMDGDLLRLARQCWDARGFGNSMSHLAVARGTADIGWTSRAYEWDYAALALIVEEAGGRFTDLDAQPALGGSGLSSNGHLHDEVLRLIRSDTPTD